MKALTTLSLALLVAVPLTANPADSQEAGTRYVRDLQGWKAITPVGEFAVNPRVITIKFESGLGRFAEQQVIAAEGGTEIRRAVTGFIDVEIAADDDPIAAVERFNRRAEVEIAEVNTFGRYGFIPDDTLYGSQWHLPQVLAEDAWDITTGSPDAIVAVLDSGTEFTHEDLGTGTDGYQNVWLNNGEDAWTDPDDPGTGNGVDDDLNGYIDDWKGYDFSNNNNDPSGPFFHGTSVAGVTSAKTNNNLGVAGVGGGNNAPGTLIMIAGVGDAAPNGSILDDAILYAEDNGAQVIQLSLTVGQSAAIDAALQLAHDSGLTIICSSGNGGGSSVGYPSSNPNVIAVGSTNMADQRSGFSQHGPDLEISAPGEGIWTTDLNDTYNPTSGTSFSSPLTSGVVALMLAVNPTLTNVEIRQILHNTADKVGGYDYNWDPAMPGHSFELGYGRVNALAAVNAANTGAIFADGFESGDTSSWSASVP